MPAAVKLARKLSRHGRPNRLAVLDKRSAEHRRLVQIRASYLDHLGGHASVGQLSLVDAIAKLTVLSEAHERHAFKNGGLMNERDCRAYMSLLNAKNRAVRQLGLKPMAEPQRSLAEFFSDVSAEAAA